MRYTRFSGPFGGVEAHQDAKASFSAALESAREFKKGSDIAFTNAQRLLTEIAPYNDWDSSWAPRAFNGYYSSKEIKSKLKKIISETPPEIRNRRDVQRAVDTDLHPVSPPIEAGKDCKSKAIQMFGPIMGLSPGADTLACHYGKIGIVVGIIVAITIAIVLVPYVQLANTALSGVRGKKKGKKRKK
jgi:hypothetical protein